MHLRIEGKLDQTQLKVQLLVRAETAANWKPLETEIAAAVVGMEVVVALQEIAGD